MRELEKIKIEYNNLNSEVKNIVNIHINKIRNYLINIDFDSSVFYRKIGRAMSDIYQYKILINSKNANFGIEIANKSSGFLLYDLDNSDIDYISLYNIDLFIDIINNKIATS